MGSDKTENRKPKDRVILRLPQPVKNEAGASGNGVPDYAEMCVISFEVKVRNVPFIKVGTKVSLERKGDKYAVMLMDIEVATLNKLRSAMVEKCNQIGIKYVGEIVNLKGGEYARFYRKTK